MVVDGSHSLDTFAVSYLHAAIALSKYKLLGEEWRNINNNLHIAFKGIKHSFLPKGKCRLKSQIDGLHHQIHQNIVSPECCLRD
jgi:hypothetical protein